MQFYSKTHPFLKIAQRVMPFIGNWMTHHCNSFLQKGGVSIPLGSFVDLRIEQDHAINTNNNGIATAALQL